MTEHPPKNTDRILRVVEYTLLGVGLAGIVLLWDAFGTSWDELTRSHHGEAILRYFYTLGSDRSVLQAPGNTTHTALPDMVAALLYQRFPEWKYAVRHTVSALCALATLPALFWYARLMGEPWAGPLASVFLLLMPVFFGHAFINSKDVPMACAFAWAVLALAWLFQGNQVTWRRVLLAGVGLGLPLTVRPGVWPLLFAFLGAAVAYSYVARGTAPHRAAHRGPIYTVPALLVISWICMVAVWPWAHQHPFLHPVAGILAASAFPTVVPVLFDGVSYSSDALPRVYLLHMIGVKTPTALLLLALLGLGWGFIQTWRNRHRRGLTYFVATLWLVAPLAAWTILTPNIYDGFRHFLFVLPALALWAAIGAVRILRVAGTTVVRGAVAVLLIVGLAEPARELVRLHPYQMTYFNRVVGGLPGAVGRYETDYWVTSYREAAEWISERSNSLDRSVQVLVAADASATEAALFFLPDHAVVESIAGLSEENCLPLPYDFYVSTTRHGWDRNFPGSPVLHSIGRDGAVFTVVRGGLSSGEECQEASSAAHRPPPAAGRESPP